MDEERWNEVLRPHTTGEGWQPCGDSFYRMHKVYMNMGWYNPDDVMKSISLGDYIHAVAPYGGPVALTLDRTKVTEVHGMHEVTNVKIFSPAGYRMGTIKWTGDRNIVGLVWASAEHLIIVQEDGACQVHNVTGGFLHAIPPRAELRIGVTKVIGSQDGRYIVLMTRDSRLFCLSNFLVESNARFDALQDIDEGAPDGDGIACIAVWSTRPRLEVLAAAHGQIFAVSREDVAPKLPIGTAVKATHMAVSWDEEKVAVFHEGMIRVYAKNFTDLKYELDTDTNVEPTSIVWCGSHSVVAYWDEEKMPSGMLLVVPGSRHQTTFSYVNRVILCPEMDGLRVISDEEHEFLQPVPDEMWSTFLAGDTGESKLYQARVFYEDRSPLADELLRSVKDAGPDAMVQAVQSLMVAAEHEWDPRLIRYLLKAARFGMDFEELVDTSPFVDLCKMMRVLKHVRDATIAIPMTAAQYRAQQPEVLISRLIARGVFWLAHEVCKFLKLTDQKTTTDVLLEWASCVINSDKLSDESKAAIIIDKLSHVRGIDFVAISRKARAAHKHELAVELLEQDPRASKQIPEMLALGKEELALEKAVASGDSDLIYVVLTTLQKQNNFGEFNRMISQYPAAQDLYVQMLRETNIEGLQSFYLQHDLHHDGGNLKVQLAYDKSSSVAELQEGLRQARSECYVHLRDEKYLLTAVEDQLKLLDLQQKLDRSGGLQTLGNSVSATLYKLLQHARISDADKMRKTFSIPDKRFWRIKIQALARGRHWPELEQFAKSKSPIGYAPFVQACISMEAMDEALKYIARLPKEERVEYLLKVSRFEEAIATAVALKSEEHLAMIEDYARAHGHRNLLRMLNDAVGPVA